MGPQVGDPHPTTIFRRPVLGRHQTIAGPQLNSFLPGAFGPDAIAAMSEVLEAAFKELQDSGQYVVREVVAGRIIAAARFGERDPARLIEAALRSDSR